MKVGDWPFKRLCRWMSFLWYCKSWRCCSAALGFLPVTSGLSILMVRANYVYDISPYICLCPALPFPTSRDASCLGRKFDLAFRILLRFFIIFCLIVSLSIYELLMSWLWEKSIFVKFELELFRFLIEPGCFDIVRFGRIKAICFDFALLGRFGSCFWLLGWTMRLWLFLSKIGSRLLDHGIGIILRPLELNFLANCSGDFRPIVKAV